MSRPTLDLRISRCDWGRLIPHFAFVNDWIFQCGLWHKAAAFTYPVPEQVYLRGSQLRYFVVPDMLRHAPMYCARAPESSDACGDLPVTVEAFFPLRRVTHVRGNASRVGRFHISTRGPMRFRSMKAAGRGRGAVGRGRALAIRSKQAQGRGRGR